MIDFIITTVLLTVLYFVIRYIYRNVENSDKKILIFYSVVALLMIFITFKDIELEGLDSFLYARVLPIIIPFIIHFGIMVFINKQAPKNKLATRVDKGEKITTLLGRKILIIAFLIISIIVNILLIIFTDRSGIALIFIISLLIFIIILIIILSALLKYKSQKIILIKGEEDYEIYLFELPQKTLEINTKNILSDENLIYDFIGVAHVLDLDNKNQEQHIIYQIKTKEAFDINLLCKQEDHYYKELKKYINQINNQTFTIIVKDKGIADFHSK